ncbi:MAG: sarcosine oxidase subunit delta [Chloroflexi bacterium]|nr:sarcosine oxidase subunit delta [Chloroflexota bacterium]
MWITCPRCGGRPVEEYRFGGEVRGAAAWITDAALRDVDYVWMYDNIEGVTTERWFHGAGCRRWLTIRRDTTTDTIVA